MLKHIAPTRYYSEMIDLTFWQALRRFLKYGKWSWQKIHFTPVYKGDSRYEAAPYEERIVELPPHGYITHVLDESHSSQYSSPAESQ